MSSQRSAESDTSRICSSCGGRTDGRPNWMQCSCAERHPFKDTCPACRATAIPEALYVYTCNEHHQQAIIHRCLCELRKIAEDKQHTSTATLQIALGEIVAMFARVLSPGELRAAIRRGDADVLEGRCLSCDSKMKISCSECSGRKSP